MAARMTVEQASAEAGTPPEPAGATLRSDIRRLVNLLGATLARQEGPELLELVEHVRVLSKGHRLEDALGELVASVDESTLLRLARAFAAYFHLANVAEQAHRARGEDMEQGQGSEHPDPLRHTAERLRSAGFAPDALADIVRRLELRPVFTAHPTEAARRSVLTTLEAMASLLDVLVGDPAPADRRRAERQLAELVDLLWQTDELRRDRPTPVEEARAALYYLGRVLSGVVPELVEDLEEELAVLGVRTDTSFRPLRFGTWVGGDRDGNPYVTSEVTAEVLRLQHDTALAVLIEGADRVVECLSCSTQVVGISDELAEALERDAALLPDVAERYGRLNAEEPYRLAGSYIRRRLEHTRRRFANNDDHVHGVDYLDVDEVLADLDVLHRSLVANHGDLLARGTLGRFARLVGAAGFHLATMDVRDHAVRLHEALAQLYAHLGELPRPYGELGPGERRALLA
ncbi:MAG: phosphoenolpyruvate carboxylase, partial [Actinomycetota bacterium]|nr:phosphoenolpyruvate carboxylase [Actinomycetota bacterium]